MKKINEIIKWNNYEFKIFNDEFEDDVINIKLKDRSLPHDYFAFSLKIKALWSRTDENFIIGDFYQEVMTKENMVEVNKKVSYASVTHEFLIAHSTRFSFIKNIYSSSLIANNYEAWTPSITTRNFWNKQLEKAPNIPVSFCDVVQRYKLIVNE